MDPTGKNESVSQYIEEAAFEELVSRFPAFLRDFLAEEFVMVSYGALSNIHPDLWYKPMKVGTNWFERFLAESIAQRIFEPGGADLLVEIRGGSAEVTLCHERDIHIVGSDDELIARLKSSNFLAPFFADK